LFSSSYSSCYHVGRILSVHRCAKRRKEASKGQQAFKVHREFKSLNFGLFSNLPKIIGSVVGLIVLIAIGVTVGVVVSKNNSKGNKSASSSGSGSSNSSSTGGGGGSNTTDPNDPSVFTKDERLHRSFYGMAYTPEGSLPDYGCNSSLRKQIIVFSILLFCINAYLPPASVIKDIQVCYQLFVPY